jgi:tRNA-specific adenosine deaminase 3
LKKNEENKIETILFNPIEEKIVAQAYADEADFPYNINHSVIKCINNFCVTLTDEYVLNNKINRQNIDNVFNNKDNEFILLGKKDYIPKINLSDDEIFYGLGYTNINNNDTENFFHSFNKLDQYYCQGLYLFTWKEPCFMCSMALVHSRIERVYFIENDKKEGALASLVKFNSYNLNHNFFVFEFNE